MFLLPTATIILSKSSGDKSSIAGASRNLGSLSPDEKVSYGKIIGEVKPEKGKIVCFDGSIFHSIKWIPKGRRIVFVSTFI